MATIFLIWKWRESASKNVRKQSVIVLRAFIITLILGVFTESVVNNVFSIRIPQLAPIIMLLPVLSIWYAMQSMDFFYTRRNVIDSCCLVHRSGQGLYITFQAFCLQPVY